MYIKAITTIKLKPAEWGWQKKDCEFEMDIKTRDYLPWRHHVRGSFLNPVIYLTWWQRIKSHSVTKHHSVLRTSSVWHHVEQRWLWPSFPNSDVNKLLKSSFFLLLLLFFPSVSSRRTIILSRALLCHYYSANVYYWWITNVKSA